MRQAKRHVARLLRLLAKDGDNQTLLRAELALPLRLNLTDQDILWLHLCANADDTVFVQVFQGIVTHVGNVAGDLFRSELGVTRLHLVSLDMDGAEHIVADEPLRYQNGILVVVAAPRHEAHQHVLAQSQLTVIGTGSIGDDLSRPHSFASAHDRLLGDAGGLVGLHRVEQRVDVQIAVLRAHHDLFRGYRSDRAIAPGNHQRPRVHCRAPLQTSLHQRSRRAQQGHCLLLHVGPHKGACCVVALEERNERRGDGYQLHGRNVHQVHLVAAHDRIAVCLVCLMTHLKELFRDGAVLQQPRIARSNAVLLFLLCREIHDLVNRLATLQAPIGGLDESELVHPRVDCQLADQSDVRTFWRFDGTDTPVVAVMHIAHFQRCGLASQASGSQCAQASLVRELTQRVGLVHKLRQLAGAEERLDGCGNRLDCQNHLRHDLPLVHGGHALFGDLLHAQEAVAQLALQQLADGTHALVLQVVDLVHLALAAIQLQQVLDHGNEVFLGHRAHVQREVKPQLLVQLVAPHARQVIAAVVVQLRGDQRSCALLRCRVAGTHLAVDIHQRLAFVVGGVVLQRCHHNRGHVQYLDLRQPQSLDASRDLRVDAMEGFDQRLAPTRLHDVSGGVLAFQLFAGGVLDAHARAEQAQDVFSGIGRRGDRHLHLQHILRQFGVLQKLLGDAIADVQQHLTRVGVYQWLRRHPRPAPVIALHLLQVGLGVQHLAGIGVHSGFDQALIPTMKGVFHLHVTGHTCLGKVLQRTQEGGDGQRTPLSDTHGHHIVGAGIDLDPGSFVWDNFRTEDVLIAQIGLEPLPCGRAFSENLIENVLEIHTWRAQNLANHHALAPVDDKGALVGHQGQVAQIYFRLLHFAGHAALDTSIPHMHPYGCLEGHIAVATLFEAVLGFAQREVQQFDKLLTREVVNRREVLKEFPKPFFQKPTV